MFGADKQAHTDAKVGPKMTGDITKESQSVHRKALGLQRKEESTPGGSCTTRLPLPLGTRC